MKKFGIAIVAALCLSATVYASGNQPVAEKWEGNVNVNKLGEYLNLNPVQSEEVSNIFTYFAEQMEKASYAKKNQNTKLYNAVYGNLKLMRQTLTNEQYNKYASVINATLRNKGIQLSKD